MTHPKIRSCQSYLTITSRRAVRNQGLQQAPCLNQETEPITYNIILHILTDEVEHEEDLVALKEDFDL